MAETAKHTPGNWTISRNTLTGAVFAGDEFIASVYPNAPEGWDGRSEYDRIDEMRANARLVAAAPDLLAIAKRVLERGYVSEHIDEERFDHLALAAAIAKAEGGDA
jgi:hypothetical protein